MLPEITTTPLQLTVDRTMDWILAVAYGEVVDGKSGEEYIPVSEERIALVLSDPGPEPRVIGFVANELEGLDPHAEDDDIWETPTFHVPLLGLRSASAGEILTAALAAYPDSSTLDAVTFHQAIGKEDLVAAEHSWNLCLASGCLKAHYGLGYTLHDLGRYHEAYAHLRYYCELVPRNGWAWCWRGKTAAALGDHQDARLAFERALELERAGGFETDADELLEELPR